MDDSRGNRIVDLSVRVDAATQGPPAAGSPPVVLETSHRTPGHWQSSRMTSLLHTGTHVDAPIHVIARGRTIDQVELGEVSGTVVVLDVHDVGEREPIDADRLALAADRLTAEDGGGPLPGEIVAVRTDWTDRCWGAFPDYYTRSPYLTEEAALWLASLGPSAVVVDFFEEECAVSPDFAPEDFVVHRALLGDDIPIVEQAMRLGEVGASRFTLHAAFTALVDVEAAPCRVFAVL